MELTLLSDDALTAVFQQHLLNDFPADEVRPLPVILDALHQGHYQALGWYKQEVLLGYAFLCCPKGNDFAFLDYFAITANARSRGYGSRFLALLKQYYHEKRGIIAEVESTRTSINHENDLLRRRRQSFYLRNGARKTAVSSVVFGVRYRVIYLPCYSEASDEEVCEAIELIYPLLMGAERAKTHTQILHR